MAERANRGIALISVPWITGLLAVMAASSASSTRTETRLAHNQEENAKAEALVDAVHRLPLSPRVRLSPACSAPSLCASGHPKGWAG
jgi:type II secretory pathway component PulK